MTAGSLTMGILTGASSYWAGWVSPWGVGSWHGEEGGKAGREPFVGDTQLDGAALARADEGVPEKELRRIVFCVQDVGAVKPEGPRALVVEERRPGDEIGGQADLLEIAGEHRGDIGATE